MINEKILACLSNEIRNKIIQYPLINEIRMRKDRPLCFTVGNKNVVTDHYVSGEEISFSVNAFCKNSLHTYFEDIKNGFIPFDNCCRIGICGKAVTNGKTVTNLSEITSLNIRLPIEDPNIPYDLLTNIYYKNGVLVYSPPGSGKTTLLRKMISFYSSPPYNKRIAVIDSRNELCFDCAREISSVDYFSGYPKAVALDIAVRTMSPEIIVCDEIGLNDDTNALVESRNSGVALICTAHARNITELLKRKNILYLHEKKVFGGYLGISVKNDRRIYEFTKLEDVIL